MKVESLVKLGKVQIGNLGAPKAEKEMIITIGKKQEDQEVSIYYQLQEKKWEPSLQQANENRVWISMYAEEEVSVGDLCEGIELLMEIQRQFNWPLKIYWDVELTEAEFNTLLLKRTRFKDHLKCNNTRIHKMRRQTNTLYEDLFYELIPEEEMIYVPINLLESKNETGYMSLNLALEKVGEDYAIIYDRKGVLDQFTSTLRPYIMPNFSMPVLMPVPIIKSTMHQPLMPIDVGRTPYTGEGVLVGFITTTGIDYTDKLFKTKEGSTRIAAMWEQTKGAEGRLYTAEQINEALQSEEPNNVIPVSKNTELINMLVRLVGTTQFPAYGLAVDAQFVTCQVKPASREIQKIYAGNYNEKAILYPDALLSIGKMVEFARSVQKPIVIVMPYQGNIGAHDGTEVYDVLS